MQAGFQKVASKLDKILNIVVCNARLTVLATQDNDNEEVQPPSTRPGLGTNMDLLMDDDNDWASQGFEYLNRRPPRSQQPRFTNPNQLSRGSCYF